MKQSARICWFIVVFCLFTSFITLPCFAMQMNIEKKTNQTTFSTDQKIYLTIEIDNVFDEDVKLAGSIDMIFEREDGDLEIYDWKRCKEIRKSNQLN